MSELTLKRVDVSAGISAGSWVSIDPLPVSATTQANTPFAADIEKSLGKSGPSSHPLHHLRIRADWMPFKAKLQDQPIQLGLFGSVGTPIGQDSRVSSNYAAAFGARASTDVLVSDKNYPLSIAASLGWGGYFMSDMGTPPGSEIRRDMSGTIHAVQAGAELSGPLSFVSENLFWRVGLGISYLQDTTLGQNKIQASTDNAFNTTFGIGWSFGK